MCHPGSHGQDRAVRAQQHRDRGSRGLEGVIGAALLVLALLCRPWEGPSLLRWVWGLGQAKENEECAATTWWYLPAGKEPVPGASQGGDFWHRWQWRGPAAVQAGESTRTGLRLLLAVGEQGSLAGTQFWGGHSAAGAPSTVSAPRISSLLVPAWHGQWRLLGAAQ